MLLVAICDDNPIHLDYEKNIVARELALWEPEIECFHNAEEMLKSMSLGDYRPEIALLDIEMEGLDGISLARRLNRMLPDCAIVFLTAYLRFASAVYEAEHVWLVAKSEMESYLPQALKKALQACRSEETAKQEILIRSGRRSVVIPVEEVLYIERFRYKTRVLLSGGRNLETAQAPTEFLAGAADGFVRCHQGYWVNMDHVVELDRDEFVLRNGDRIAISRTYRDKARESFFSRFK